MNYPQIVPLSLLPLKVGVMSPAPMGAPPMLTSDSVGLASVNLAQLAPKAAVLCEITRNDGLYVPVLDFARLQQN